MTAFRFRWERALVASELPTRAKAVGLVMAMYADADGGSVFPGVERLATETGQGARTVKRALAELRSAAYVALVSSGQWRRGKADEYRLSLPSASGANEALTRGPSATAQGAPVAHHQTSTKPSTRPVDDAAAEKDLDLEALASQAPSFYTQAEIEAQLATAPQRLAGVSAGSDPLRSSPPKQPHPKDATYRRNALDREAREQGFDPDTGEYLNRDHEGSPTRRNRRSRSWD